MLRRVLDGRYRSEELLGSGGMGEVWRGRDLRLDRPVAIKMLSAAGLEEPMAAERFDREARAAARLSHPHIVGVYDFGSEEDGSYLVMELVEGRAVSALVADGPLPVEQAVSIAAQAADGIAAAHAAGVVHRDVKPGNLIVTPSGTVKICDFGIARLSLAAGHATLTGPATKLGTSSYMAPEQALGRPLDHRSDLYGLGCTLYAMLAGTPPFAGDPLIVLHQHVNDPPPPLRDRRPDVPAVLDALVSELLAKDPADRPTDAGEVRDRLTARGTFPEAMPPLSPPQRPSPDRSGRSVPVALLAMRGDPGTGGRPGRRRRGLLLVAAGVLGVALLALVAAALPERDTGTSVAPPTGAAMPASSAAVRPGVTTVPATAAPTTPAVRTAAPVAPAEPTAPMTSRAPSPQAVSRTPAPPADPVVAMRLSIQEQVEAGQLNPDAARDLHGKVDAIAKEIAEADPEQAQEQLKKLRDKLTELRRGGRLSATGYDELAAGADRIAAEL